MSVSVWPLPSIKVPYFFEEVTYWTEKFLPVFLSASQIDIRTGGGEESRREWKERGLFHPYATLFLTLKTRCVSIRDLINLGWNLRRLLSVKTSVSYRRPSLHCLADCDDVLSQSRLRPSSFLLSCCCSLLFICHLLHSRDNERSPWNQCKTEDCCMVLSHTWTSDYMGIYSIFNGLMETENVWGLVLCQKTSQVVLRLLQSNIVHVNTQIFFLIKSICPGAFQ